jgi:hypothetical protein
VKFKVLISLFVIFVSFFAYGDAQKKVSLKHPQISNLIIPEEEDYRCYNSFDDDGITTFHKDKNIEILLVNYIFDCNNRIEPFSTFVEIEHGKYKKSKLTLPNLQEVNFDGEIYSLHMGGAYIESGNLIIKYSFACKKPSRYLKFGGCSKNKSYEAKLFFKLVNKRFELKSKSVNVKI